MSERPTTQIESAPSTAEADPFDDVDETDEPETVQTTSYMPKSLHERLRRHAFETRKPMAEHIRRAVEHYLDQNDA
jgi:hypothetical protein